MGDIYTVVGRITAAPTIPATVVMVTAGGTKRCWLHEMEIGSTNASAVAGAEISVGIPTTAGTGGVGITPLPIDVSAPAAIFTALTATTPWSAEPSQPATWHLRTGIDALTTFIWVPKHPVLIQISTRLAVRIETDGSATKANWACTLKIEE